MRIRILPVALMRILHSDADPDPTFQYDPNPATPFFPDLDPPMLQNDPPPFHFQANPDPAFHFDADQDTAFSLMLIQILPFPL
jgi:hypothetical protein